MFKNRVRLGDGARRVAVAGGFIALLLLLAGCSGGSDEPDGDPSDGGATTVAPSQQDSSPSASGAIEDQAFTVGEDFWHSGFHVEIVDGEIISTENQLSGKVTRFLFLDAILENNDVDTGYFGPSLVVATSNNNYPSQFGASLPDVPGGLKTPATFEFLIDENFDLASAVLIIGDADENQAQIPLGDGGDAMRLEPSELAISGLLSMELIDMEFTSATLRYDLPDRHRQVEKGKQALTLNLDVTSRRDGNWQVFAKDLALVFPDGTAIAPDDIEFGSLPGSDAGVTTPDRWVRFLVDEEPAGDYTLRFTPGTWFVGEDGVTEATFDFTIGP
jgi:hypothetical protein